MTSQPPGLETTSAVTPPLAAQPAGAPYPRAGAAEERSPIHMGRPTITPLQLQLSRQKVSRFRQLGTKEYGVRRKKKNVTGDPLDCWALSVWLWKHCLCLRSTLLLALCTARTLLLVSLGHRASKPSIWTF